MANPTGFLQYPRVEVEHRPIDERIQRLARDRPAAWSTACSTSRPPAAWTAASPSATPSAARCRTAFPSSTTWSTATAGARRPRTCTRPTTSPRSPAGSAPPRARPPARWRSTTSRSTSSTSSTRSPSGPSPRAGSQPLAAQGQDRQAGGRRRLRAGRAGRRAAVGPRRARRRRVREETTASAACLRYGIPDFKLEKHVLDRRLEQMVAEGVKFEPNVNVGVDISAAELRKRFDADRALHGGRPAAGAARAGRRSAGRPLRHGLSRRSRTAAWPAIRRSLQRRAEPASLHAQRQARDRHRRRRHGQRLRGHGHPPGGPSRSRNWKSCPSRPKATTPETPGPSGRRSCGRLRRRRKAASAAGAR